MKYSFHPEAKAEFNHVIEYYKDCVETDFAIEIYCTGSQTSLRNKNAIY